MKRKSEAMRCLRIGCLTICMSCAAISSQGAAPPDTMLPDERLATLASRADPNVVLDLALDVSHAGAAYRGEFDATVSHAGLWDPMGCYSYSGGDGYFKRETTAQENASGEIVCNRQWSGNLLNWAATSTIDGVRMALTGGDRSIDRPDRTVLRRAEVPAHFYRSTHFPDKVLKGRIERFTPLSTGDSLHFNNCGGKLFVGSSANGTCAAPGSDQVHGAFQAHVAVCTPDEAAVRGALCLKYPSGHFKPVGAVQRHSDRMRFSVFGNLAGDALLAPMKHVGPVKLDAAFDKVANAQSEWDARTGVFEIATGASDGVIDAIHRFGRSGVYGRPDAAVDLYAQSLRYLQGIAPGRGIADPVVAACQKNHIVKIGDAGVQGDRSADDALARLVNDLEKSVSSSPASATGMAGMAYRANTQKLRADHPDMRARTLVIDMGPPGSGRELAAKYGGFVDVNGDSNPFRTSAGAGLPAVRGDAEWAEGLNDDGRPRPRTYFRVAEPRAVAAAVQRIFRDVSATADRELTDGAVSEADIANGHASIYVSESIGQRGAGSLLSFPLTYDIASGAIGRAERPRWDAGALLGERTPASRRIFTLSAAGAGIPFEWHALDDVFKGYLDGSPRQPATRDVLGAERLAYLRGDRRKEESAPGGVFRVRDSVMGRIVHSAPLVAKDRRSGSTTVYVGANDGMLHAFSADKGDELFAYVPRSLAPRLSSYTTPDHPHGSLVDGSATVADVQLAGVGERSVLVSGLGGGASGVFALDVTEPAAFSARQVMWEFSGADDADMGYQTQAPRVLKFRTAVATRTEPASYRWFAVVPSGFNNANPQKRAALFLLSLDKPASEPWRRDVNYHKIMLPVPTDAAVSNALGVPGDYAGVNGATRLLYAGDTQGNLWRFDFTGGAPWREGNALSFKGRPLMVALGERNRRQPITAPPKVGIGPNGGAVVLFGTGKFVGLEDLGRANWGVQTFYSVYDNGVPLPEQGARTQLQARRAGAGAGTSPASITGDAFEYGVFDAKTSIRRGWYLDLPESREKGERMVAEPVLADGLLFFNTLIPPLSACARGGGRSCAVNAMTGLSKGGTCVPSDTGMPGKPQVVYTGHSVLGATDALGRRTETRRLSVVNMGGGGGKNPLSTVEPVEGGKVSQTTGRLNWRQVIDHRGVKQ